MCYHNSIHAQPEELIREYSLDGEQCPEFESISHSSGFDFPEWPILTAQHPDRYILGKWGLIPSWAQDDPVKAARMRSSTLNARVETLLEKPAFRETVLHAQRCLIPSTGFFEWKTVGKEKYPYFIRPASGKLFSLAGLWEYGEESITGEGGYTFTIITVPANPLMAEIHNTKKRMPAILTKEMEAEWMRAELTEAEIQHVLTPISEDALTAYTIKPFLQPGRDKDFERITTPHDYPALARQLGLF